MGCHWLLIHERSLLSEGVIGNFGSLGVCQMWGIVLKRSLGPLPISEQGVIAIIIVHLTYLLVVDAGVFVSVALHGSLVELLIELEPSLVDAGLSV